MNEIKEIMNGNIKIFNMRIEGETIGFDTPYNSNWNFMARDFEQIIDTLQQENARLKDKIEKIIEYVNHYETIRGYYEYEECGYDEYNYEEDLKEELLEKLKEN